MTAVVLPPSRQKSKFRCRESDDRSHVVAKLLLEHGCFVDSLDYARSTALMLAAMRGLTRLVKVLIANHADLDAADVTGNTALHYACAYKHTRVANILEVRPPAYTRILV